MQCVLCRCLGHWSVSVPVQLYRLEHSRHAYLLHHSVDVQSKLCHCQPLAHWWPPHQLGVWLLHHAADDLHHPWVLVWIYICTELGRSRGWGDFRSRYSKWIGVSLNNIRFISKVHEHVVACDLPTEVMCTTTGHLFDIFTLTVKITPIAWPPYFDPSTGSGTVKEQLVSCFTLPKFVGLYM